MAATALTVAKTTRSLLDIGVPVVQTEANGDNVNGNSFPNTGRELLYVRNSSGGALTVQVQDRGAVLGTARSVSAGSSALIGPFPVQSFNDTSGNVTFTPSASTLKVLVFQLDHPGVLNPSIS